MKKLDAQHVCDILNENAKHNGFIEAIRRRVPVSNDVALNSDVNCNKFEDVNAVMFDSSVLGFINALVNEPICMGIITGTGEAIEINEGVYFALLSKANETHPNTKEGK